MPSHQITIFKPLNIFGFLVFSFIFSLFLTLGSDTATQYTFRLCWSGVIFCAFLWAYRKKFEVTHLFQLTFLCFGGFVLFEILRALYALGLMGFTNREAQDAAMLSRYLEAPIQWTVLFMFLVMPYFYFERRSRVQTLLSVMAWGGFLVAAHAIPPLVAHGYAGYEDANGRTWFFLPIFYSHAWLPKYLVGRFGHPNWTGDVIAFGFFPALGLSVYGILALMDSFLKDLKEKDPGMLMKLILSLLIAFLCAAAIVLMFSRGSIICFVLTLVIFFAFLLMKYFSLRMLTICLSITATVCAFLLWTGDMEKVWKEVQTIKIDQEIFDKNPDELVRYRGRSVLTNKEGARRAIAIYKSYPVLGVGTGGYTAKSKLYASSEGSKRFKVANVQAMCHYLQLLAEEGAGAYLYFLFLCAYAFQALKGLLKTKSRFQFIMALSLVAPVIMIMGHAVFNHLMQRFAMSLFVFISMGASLGILRADFSHGSAGIVVKRVPHRDK